MTDVGKTPVARSENTSSEFGYVGIDAILEQMRRKAMKQGFEFNIMVVGKYRCECASTNACMLFVVMYKIHI